MSSEVRPLADPLPKRDRGQVGSFWRDIGASLRNREFWWLSSWIEILVRVRRSRLGVLWLLIPPIVYVFGLGSFFAAMMRQDFTAHWAYVGLGAMAFRALMATVIGSAGAFHSAQSFILDGRIRLTDYILQLLARALFDVITYLPVVIVVLSIAPTVSWLGLALSPVILLLVYVNVMWMATLGALIGARFMDFGQAVANISMFVFLLTPIVWPLEMAPAESLRGQFMRFNPFFHFISVFRNPILGVPVEPLSWWVVGISTVLGLLLAAVAYRRYARFVPLWI